MNGIIRSSARRLVVARIIVLVPLALSACDTEREKNTLDCIGMDNFLSGARTQRSSLAAFDRQTEQLVVRCAWEHLEGYDSQYEFFFDGAYHRSVDFSRKVSSSGEGWEEGTYSARVGVWSSNIPPAEDQLRTVGGRYSFCDQGAKGGECPYGPEDGLEQRYQLTSPLRPDGMQGGASECTLIYDRQHDVVSLDIVLATFNGFNVGRIGTWCTIGQFMLAQPGLVHFEAAGISDYGNTGPMPVQDYPGRSLPSLSYERDYSIAQVSLPGRSCADIGARARALTTPESTCELEFDQSGSVRIACTEVDDQGLASSGVVWDSGNFTLEANCLIVER